MLATELGIDAVGLVFYPQSPRAVTFDQARQVIDGLAPKITVVGLFVNASPKAVEETLSSVSLHVLQFHGDENSLYCESFGKPYLKAIRVKPGFDLGRVMAQYPTANGFLLDSFNKSVYGGSGERFDWALIPAQLRASNKQAKVILAGGLQPDNVGSAIKQVQPFAVDVSSGVEASPGIKDAEKMKAFVKGVRAADSKSSRQ